MIPGSNTSLYCWWLYAFPHWLEKEKSMSLNSDLDKAVRQVKSQHMASLSCSVWQNGVYRSSILLGTMYDGCLKERHFWVELAPFSPSQASAICELWTYRCSSWFWKRQRNQRSNRQHPLDHQKSKRVQPATISQNPSSSASGKVDDHLLPSWSCSLFHIYQLLMEFPEIPFISGEALIFPLPESISLSLSYIHHQTLKNCEGSELYFTGEITS